MQDWKAKFESVYSFMLKYSKLPVCVLIVSIDELEASEIMLRGFSSLRLCIGSFEISF
jgi:hypothetical protein